MSDFFSVYIYFGLITLVTFAVLAVSGLFPANALNPVKYMPYESGIRTESHLLQERFPLRHYLVALIFLVFDIEVVFLYPWAVVGKQLGMFGLFEIAFFMAALSIGFLYLWKKGGLEWE